MANEQVQTEISELARGSLFDHLAVRLVFIAWRNLWRNRRRTWLTIGGIAFAIWLLIFGRSMQEGTFGIMIDNGARLMTGHIQVQHPSYEEDPRVEHTFNAAEALALIRVQPGVEFASARAQGFALVSGDDRSFGAQILGVETATEGQWSGLVGMLSEGRYPERTGEILIGTTLARNLALELDDEMVVLGTAKRGGVAALSAEIVGIFDTAQPEINRSLVVIDVEDFRSAWLMGPDEAHAIVVIADSVIQSERLAPRLREALSSPDQTVLGWQELLREAEQMRDMKAVGTEVMFAVIAIIITFSVINTFMMVIFERTPEFGVLQAMGMKLRLIIAQLQLEALFLSVLGIAFGFLFSWVLIYALSGTGIPMPIPDDAAEYYARFNMGTHIIPEFNWSALETGALVLFIGVQLASLLPALRLRKMRPVEAIRQET